MAALLSIAVVTPSYNTGRYIGDTIRSVLDQNYPNLDYVVMDGGSTDDTLQILRGFGTALRWTSQKDKGQGDAIRRGFEQTTGEILGWLNSDDLYRPGALHAVAEFFAAHSEIDVVYGDADYIDSNGNHIAPCVHVEPYKKTRLLHYSDFIVQPAAFFRRSAYEAVGGINPTLHWALDYDLWLRLAAQHRFAYLPEHLASYRWLGENKTATGGMERLEEIASIFRIREMTPPAYIQLERVNQHARAAIRAIKRFHMIDAARRYTRAAVTLLRSPRAIASLTSPHTWKVIWVGQVLRNRGRRAMPADRSDS